VSSKRSSASAWPEPASVTLPPASTSSKHAPRPAQKLPGLLDGYDRFGGIQASTGPLANALRHASVRSPLSKRPFTEIEINGICGGPGFLYAVFEYTGWPPILSLALQSRSMPDAYVGEGISRLGLRTMVHETTSRVSARRMLDQTLAAGKVAICIVDIASLPWYGLPPEFIGGGPHVVTVAGRDADRYWIDDRSSRPIGVDADTLAAARAAYRQAKNRWSSAGLRVDRVPTRTRRWSRPLRAVPRPGGNGT
jgi:Butirosin biosynthesis protein H, N-terminal